MIRILALCALPVPMAAMADTVISLYPAGTVVPLPRPESQDLVEGQIFVFNISAPTLEVIRPTKEAANGTAVIIAPGGGFVGLAYEQSMAVARRLADLGVTAFVLKYRTIESPDDGTAAFMRRQPSHVSVDPDQHRAAHAQRCSWTNS
ncbi:hypothetical protein PSAL_032670 [Pseudooceanicola algae]|uniref:Alpha/beta hydrolase fold protein n=1 Tax=Pseudooceanicola algae TaxID=1537215 RepID=A0A418SJ05_9RHOB|nr:hypothetical protein PSAL_032670 [Pseudooceanicola algae]